MYPMLLKPVLKSYIWGGRKLKEEFFKASGFEKTAESWELSCHKDGLCVIKSGEFSGLTLLEYLKNNKAAAGTNCLIHDEFPILIKLIDANDNLSVQVHPGNEYARLNEGQNGKFEVWYIVDCEKDAEIIYGFNRDVTRDELRERIAGGTLLEVLNRVKVKPGELYAIEPGTVHAIGRGIVLAEVQQSSNVTYRVYDYDRRDGDGNPRELHIEKALDVININRAPYLEGAERETEEFDAKGNTRALLCDTEYFTAFMYEFSGRAEFCADKSSFNCLLVLEGDMNINGEKLIKGDCCFIPAGFGNYTVKGNAKFIFVRV
jgi:mannose-6-phosphate isomerase